MGSLVLSVATFAAVSPQTAEASLIEHLDLAERSTLAGEVVLAEGSLGAQ